MSEDFSRGGYRHVTTGVDKLNKWDTSGWPNMTPTFGPRQSEREIDSEDRSGEELPEEIIDALKKMAKYDTAIKSDGGSSSYYDIDIPNWLINIILARQEEGRAYVKTEELIEVAFNNDFNFGTLFKSTVRAYGCSVGKGKSGNNMEYEVNKVKYYSDKIHDRYARSGHS